MSPYRNALPQFADRLFVTDGGLETTLIFHDGLDLPHFAAIHALGYAEGRESMERYYRSYRDIALNHGTGLLLESCTWRASSEWGERLGYSSGDLRVANREAVAMLHSLRDADGRSPWPYVVSGCVGPRGDGYVVGSAMTAREAADYHDEQIATFSETNADMVGAITMTYAEEAIGVVRASERHGMPVAISFTVETDGRLPSGQPLGEAIRQVDSATSDYAAYFMINCAHPTHFQSVLETEEPWRERIRGLRANASRKSHEELDNAEDLDDGDPEELGAQYGALKRLLPALNVVGGCCGTDHRHVDRMAAHCLSLAA